MNETELRNSGLTDLPANDGSWVLLTKDQFKDGVRAGIYDSNSGKGFYATDSLIAPLEASIPNFYTDTRMASIPAFVTHIAWYPNK